MMRSIAFTSDGVPVHFIKDLLTVTIVLPSCPELQELASLEPKEASLNGAGAAQPPQEAGQSKDQLSFNG